MIRRFLLMLLAPALTGALLLTGLLELAAVLMKTEDIAPEPALTSRSPERIGVTDGFTTASTTAPAVVGPVGSGPSVPAAPSLELQPSHVLDGRTLATPDATVSLAGIEVPEAQAVCLDAQRRRWACGLRARAALNNLTRSHSVRCQPVRSEEPGHLLADCVAGGTDLARALIESGWARPDAANAARFAREVETARRKRVGLWAGDWTFLEASRSEPNLPAPSRS